MNQGMRVAWDKGVGCWLTARKQGPQSYSHIDPNPSKTLKGSRKVAHTGIPALGKVKWDYSKVNMSNIGSSRTASIHSETLSQKTATTTMQHLQELGVESSSEPPERSLGSDL